jgi:hypothetical protein
MTETKKKTKRFKREQQVEAVRLIMREDWDEARVAAKYNTTVQTVKAWMKRHSLQFSYETVYNENIQLKAEITRLQKELDALKAKQDAYSDVLARAIGK